MIEQLLHSIYKTTLKAILFQARLVELETPKRLEHLQKLEDLKRHLLELEKQVVIVA